MVMNWALEKNGYPTNINQALGAIIYTYGPESLNQSIIGLPARPAE